MAEAPQQNEPERSLEAADEELVRHFDEAMVDAARRAGDLFGCGPGNSRCCRGPFRINLLDAHRLNRGMKALAARDPTRAKAVGHRASRVVRRFSKDFPGDPATGILSGDERAAGQFLGRHGGLMCPALDPATGRCDVYEWRPLACRAMGPPVRFGRADLSPCPYCFGPASADDVARCRALPDPEGRQDALLAEIETRVGLTGDTLIAFALVQDDLWKTRGRPGGLPE